jgi:isopenicillin-N epimerase
LTENQDIMQTRRRFLRTSSAALAGGLVAGTASAAADGSCRYAELPTDFIYLNSGTEGSMPGCVLSVFQEGLQKYTSNPTTSYETDAAFGKYQVLNREKIAAFLEVGKNNICLTDNTTMGLSMTLMGLNFGPSDKVVTTNHEHTAIRSPLRVLQQRHVIEILSRPFPAAETLGRMKAGQLLETLFPNTNELQGATALCVSHVYPGTGIRLPLNLLRQKADQLNIRYLIVDGAQAMGMLDLTSADDDIRHCDFYACPGHKWLNAAPSTGVLYIKNEKIRPPEFYPILSQRMEKYADCNIDTDDCFPMVEALQVRGNSNTPGFAAMVRATKLVDSAGGASVIEKHILRLSVRIKETILEQAPDCIVSPHTDATLATGLTVFFPFRWGDKQSRFTDKETADWVVAELLKKNIQIRSIGFNNSIPGSHTSDELFALRVSTAYFNTDEQVTTFQSALRDVLTHIG